MLTATYKLCEKSLGWVVSNLYRIVSPYVACNFYIKQCNLERTNIATLRSLFKQVRCIRSDPYLYILLRTLLEPSIRVPNLYCGLL